MIASSSGTRPWRFHQLQLPVQLYIEAPNSLRLEEMSTTDANKPLAGKIAVVAGATRGAGRGIATMLGDAGATVICTGRSTRGNPATPGRPESIEETAEMVTAAGGVGVALRVDHTIADEVRVLFEKVERDFSRLDLLVNDIWGGAELSEWGKPFWKLDPAKGLKMQE